MHLFHRDIKVGVNQEILKFLAKIDFFGTSKASKKTNKQTNKTKTKQTKKTKTKRKPLLDFCFNMISSDFIVFNSKNLFFFSFLFVCFL